MTEGYIGHEHGHVKTCLCRIKWPVTRGSDQRSWTLPRASRAFVFFLCHVVIASPRASTRGSSRRPFEALSGHPGLTRVPPKQVKYAAGRWSLRLSPANDKGRGVFHAAFDRLRSRDDGKRLPKHVEPTTPALSVSDASITFCKHSDRVRGRRGRPAGRRWPLPPREHPSAPRVQSS